MGQAGSSNNRSVFMLRAITIKLATEVDRDHPLRNITNLILELKVNGQAVDYVNLLSRRSRTGTWKGDEFLILPTTDTGFVLSVFMKVSREERRLICSMELYERELLGRRVESRLTGHEGYPSMIINAKSDQAEATNDIVAYLEDKADPRIGDFQRHQDLDSLQQAISQLRFAFEMTSENDTTRARVLGTLGQALYNRFGRLGRLEDIKDAVAQQQTAVILMPDEDPDKLGLLSNLGTFLQARFERLGNLGDIDNAVAQLQTLVDLTPDGHPNKSKWLNNLGNSLRARFECLGNLEDIDKAVAQHRAAVKLTPDGHPDKNTVLNSLGSSLRTRFQRLGHLEDIDDAVSQYQAAVDLTPDGHPHKPKRLSNLGNSLKTRFERLGHLEDIDNAVAQHRTAVNFTPDDHPDKPQWLNNLGSSLMARFQRQGNLEDIDKAVAQRQAAVNLTPDGHPDKPGRLSDFGNSLRTRFERLGHLEDIDDAVARHQAAVNLTPDRHPNKPGRLSNLGISLWTCFKRLGHLEDIENAVTQQQMAVNLIPDDHPDKPMLLTNLVNSLTTRFQRLGHLEDIDNAVAQQQAAVNLTPDGHPGKPGRLSSLGNSLLFRFEHLERLEDIDDAVAQHQAAVSLTPDGHPDKPIWLNNLGNSLEHRFKRLRNPGDIDNAVAQQQAAVNLTPDGHPHKPMWFNSLGNSLQTRFIHLGNLEDIDKAVAQHQAAANLTPDDHSDKPMCLNSLGNTLQARFQRLGNLEDIDNAVARQQTAVKLTPDDHPNKPTLLNNLGRSFGFCFHHFKNPRDAEASISQHRAAAKSSVGSPSTRLLAAKEWIVMASTTNHESLLDAFDCALSIIPLIVWLGLPITERHQHLLQIREITRFAAAEAIKLGHYDRALEWLEQVRSIVWNQVLQLRTPVDHLREVEPELADRLLQVSKLLDHGTQQEGSRNSTKLSLEEEGRRYRALATEWEALVSRARSIAGFEDFLRPRKISRLVGAAKNGPVVVVNITDTRCDALILPNEVDEVIHLPLPNLTLEIATQLQVDMKALLISNGVRLRAVQVTSNGTSGDEGCKQILAELWNRLVNPVLESLAFTSCPDTDTPPRIWWSVTGPLAFLPIHAAGIYDEGLDGSHTYNCVISSYTPTLSALLEPSNVTIGTSFRHLSVVEPSSGSSYIPNTEQELKNIQARLGNREHVVCNGPKATRANVMQGMKDCNWLHLACHGKQNIKEPTKSALLLHDGDLALEDIIKLDLPTAEFAFLSACQTMTGDETLTDEALHIAGGMLLVGYRSVVATMWSIEDALAPEVADEFYRHLMKDGVRADNRKAAEALHFSMKRLRKELGQGKKVPMISWIPFVHLGI